MYLLDWRSYLAGSWSFVKMRISDLTAVLLGVTVNSILLWQKGLGEIGCYKIVMAKKDLFKYSEH